MELYRVIKPIELDKGIIVQLSKEQAIPRLRDLKPLKDNKYAVKGTIQFKRGELIGIDAVVTKRYAGLIESVQLRQAKT